MVRASPRQATECTYRTRKPLPGRRWLWSLEQLASRTLLTPMAYQIDTTASTTMGAGASGSLPYIVGLANSDTNPAGSLITFDPTLFGTPQTITLADTLALSGNSGADVIDPTDVSPITIRGAGIAGRLVIEVDPGSTATLKDLMVANEGATTGGGTDNAGKLTLSGEALLPTTRRHWEPPWITAAT